MNLHLGCGNKRMAGFVNVDIRENPEVDEVVDLNKLWPWKDGSICDIFSDNVLEHLDNLDHVFSEAHRVLKYGGTFWGLVPYAGSHWAFQDPTHKHFFTERTFEYFCRKGEWLLVESKLVSTATTTLGKLRNLIPLKSIFKYFLWNMYDDVSFKLQRI